MIVCSWTGNPQLHSGRLDDEMAEMAESLPTISEGSVLCVCVCVCVFVCVHASVRAVVITYISVCANKHL